MPQSNLSNSNKCRPAPNSIEELEDRLSAPPDRLVEMFRRVSGDILVLGVGGKMGPTLARMARRAVDAAQTPRRIIGVSRFRSPAARESLEQNGVETIAGDLTDESFVQSLPDAPLIVYMAGFKFGAADSPATTWAMNCYPPALVCRRFPNSRIAAFSTGNVYGFTNVERGGSVETDSPNPLGEYAMAALGRERMFEYFSQRDGAGVALLRLNYALDLRYGVVVDLAQRIMADEPIDLSMGYVNLIWQGDANAMALLALEHAQSPPFVVNIAGEQILSVRELAEQLGELLNVAPRFVGNESSDALLSNGRLGYERLGAPETTISEVMQWTAQWISHDRETLGKPTHFEVRDGKY